VPDGRRGIPNPIPHLGGHVPRKPLLIFVGDERQAEVRIFSRILSGSAAYRDLNAEPPGTPDENATRIKFVLLGLDVNNGRG